MNREQEQALSEHIKAIAKILYEDTKDNIPEKLTSLAGIESAVRSQMQKYVMPQVGVFLSPLLGAQAQGMDGGLKASAGVLPIHLPSSPKARSGTA